MQPLNVELLFSSYSFNFTTFSSFFISIIAVDINNSKAIIQIMSTYTATKSVLFEEETDNFPDYEKSHLTHKIQYISLSNDGSISSYIEHPQ